jgi:Protein of unknown function (DUF2817)
LSQNTAHPIAHYFSETYSSAREKFLRAAESAGAAMVSIKHPLQGPGGEDIYMDVASLGPDHAESAIVIISGTHGIEGFCGSGCQVALLNNSAALEKFADIKLVLLHGHNPHGFAWLRRVNEDNIDLNRNYVDFSEEQDPNEFYLEVKDLVLPEQFNDASEAAMQQWIKDNGVENYQKAVMNGQRIDPQGVFYGGTEVSWSNRTVHKVLSEVLAEQKNVALMDVHTGLGPYGHGDLIHAYPKGTAEYDTLAEWFGDEMIAIAAGEYGEVEAVPRGPIVSSLDTILPEHRSFAFVNEYGTVEFDRVIKAIRADNWLHLKGDLDSEQGRAIKQEMRDCFYCVKDEWRQKIWDRALWSCEKMAEGLRSL